MNSTSARSIGQMLKKLRLEQGLSLRDVAQKAGKNHGGLYKIEKNGIHGFDVLAKYLDILGYDMEIRITPKELANGKSNHKED